MSFDLEAFQHDAFQSGAFQSEVAAEAFFQCGAFQANAFQTAWDCSDAEQPPVIERPPITGGGGKPMRRDFVWRYEIPITPDFEQDDDEAILTLLIAIAHHEFSHKVPVQSPQTNRH